LPSALLEGRWDEAAELTDVTLPGSPGSILRSVRIPIRGWLAREQGDVAAAWAAVREVHRDGATTDPGGYFFLAAQSLQRLAATLALDSGDLATARTWLAAHDRWLEWSGALLGRAEGCLLWAAYHRQAGDAEAARFRAIEALEQATEPRQPLVRLAAQRLLGELDTLAGRYTTAGGYLEQALQLSDACAAPYERAQTLLALASLRQAEGERNEARSLLAAVDAICGPLGGTRVLGQAAALLALLDATPPALPGPLAELTRRELDVIREVALGATNAQIAEKLYISPRTVDHHLRSIYGKLGVASRTAAARLAIDHGLE
jgi:DNA-binding CsgD family transcriptional regulator